MGWGRPNLRPKNSLDNLNQFYDVVKAALKDPNWNSCSISIEFDNTVAHSYTDADVKGSFHALYKYNRMGKKFNYRSPHSVYKNDSDTVLSLFESLKNNFVWNVGQFVDVRYIKLRKDEEKFKVSFNLTKLEVVE